MYSAISVLRPWPRYFPSSESSQDILPRIVPLCFAGKAGSSCNPSSFSRKSMTGLVKLPCCSYFMPLLGMTLALLFSSPITAVPLNIPRNLYDMQNFQLPSSLTNPNVGVSIDDSVSLSVDPRTGQVNLAGGENFLIFSHRSWNWISIWVFVGLSFWKWGEKEDGIFPSSLELIAYSHYEVLHSIDWLIDWLIE